MSDLMSDDLNLSENDVDFLSSDPKETDFHNHHRSPPPVPTPPQLILGSDISATTRNDGQELSPPNMDVPESEKRPSAPRVSFAPQPSYFLDPVPMTDPSPRRNSKKRSSHHKRRKSSHDHSDRALVKGDDGDEREQENDRRNSSSRTSSRRSNSSSNNRGRDSSSSSRRSSHHRRSNSHRRRSHSSPRDRHSSSTRRSEHGGRRDGPRNSRGSDLETPNREEDMVKMDDADLHECSSDEENMEDHFDDEYDAEVRGRRGRKRTRSKERKSESERRSSSIKRDHSRHDRSSSFKHSKSSRHNKNKRNSHTRSRSLDEIRTGHEMRSHSTSEVAPKPIQRRDTKDMEDLKLVAKEKSRQRAERRLRNRAMVCFGILLCCLSTLGVLVVVIIRGGALDSTFLTPTTGQTLGDQKPVLTAPTAEKCRAISKGVRTTSESDQMESSGGLKHFQIRMEVELDDQKKESDVPFLPLLESTLQEQVMPVLAGCEPVTPRRHRRMRSNGVLPDYVISNGLIVDAQFDLNSVASQSSQQSKYPVVVLVDIWVQEEVKNRLLKNKVWKVFEGFMDTPGIPEDFPLSKSMVLGVDVIPNNQDSKGGTPFPTLEPSPRPSHAPSIMDSTVPTLRPSTSPSMNPSSLPSLRPTGLPSTKPTITTLTPTALPSVQPSEWPTPRPTPIPTRSPSVAPVTTSPTRAPVPVDTSVEVVIVGAGAAGLTAAYHLQRKGVSVVVLEASNQIGGRVRKDSTWDLGIDLGGEWVDFRASKYSDSNDLLSAILDRTVSYQTIREPNLAHTWTGSTMEYDPPGSQSEEFRWVDSTWWDFLNRELMSYLRPNTVLLESVVKTIDYGYEKPLVKCADGRTYEASYVIVTASMKTLQDGMISFLPSLPSRYKEAIDDIEMGSGVKVFLEFREKFFPDIFQLGPDKETFNFKDCESSRHGVRYFYSPTYGQTSSKHILGMFAYADIADLYIGKPHSTIIQSVLGLLDQIFGGKASATFVKGVVQDWSSEPYVRAAYTMVAPKDAVEQLRRPIDDKVFFAGESVFSKDSDWGFVHGAALCGEDVADDIVDAINGQQ